ncbi:MAG: hypothetical protein EON52_28545 [Actinomycetales bacterium]|nr:MAG: hypothetical protein EON52_28545 [Actinomycetales bacterium]
MLEHRRFVELLPQVYVHPEADFGPRSLTSIQWIHAARLALPSDAVLSHQTRFVELGLEIGALLPLHFTVGRDLHLAFDTIMLHRTEVLPLHDELGVSIEAAFLGVAATMRSS